MAARDMQNGNPIARIADGISLRQLRLFEAIGEFNSVRRASEECSLSQPAVTQSLSKLEQQIDAILVDRTASGSFLNERGAILHERTVRFFQQLGEALVDCGVCHDGDGAKLVLNRLTRAQIRSLVAMMEHGGTGPAAASLGITVASLQRAMRDLEANLSMPLLYRTAMGALVNPKGLEMGRRFKIALQEIEFGIEEMAELAGQSQREMAIGALPFGGSVLLGGVCDEFTRANPHAKLQISSDGAHDMLEKLRAGEVDFVVGLLPDEADRTLSFESLARTPYTVAARRDHPLAIRGKARREELLRHDWIVGTSGSSRRHFFDRLFDEGEVPSSQITSCSPAIIRQLLSQSDRLTLMTTYELQQEPTLRPISFDRILEAPSIGIITRRNWQPTRLHGAFIELLRRFTSKPETVNGLRLAS